MGVLLIVFVHMYWCVRISTFYLLGCFCCLSFYPLKPKDYTLCPTFWMWHAHSCSSITLFMLFPLYRIPLSPSILKVYSYFKAQHKCYLHWEAFKTLLVLTWSILWERFPEGHVFLLQMNMLPFLLRAWCQSLENESLVSELRVESGQLGKCTW